MNPTDPVNRSVYRPTAPAQRARPRSSSHAHGAARATRRTPASSGRPGRCRRRQKTRPNLLRRLAQADLVFLASPGRPSPCSVARHGPFVRRRRLPARPWSPPCCGYHSRCSLTPCRCGSARVAAPRCSPCRRAARRPFEVAVAASNRLRRRFMVTHDPLVYPSLTPSSLLYLSPLLIRPLILRLHGMLVTKSCPLFLNLGFRIE